MNDYLRWREQFASALDPRLYPIAYLDALVGTFRAQCFTTDRAAIVTEIKTFPTGARAVAGLIAAGDLTEIETVLIPQAEEWGRLNGCAFGMIDSRPGWAKRMKKHGYRTWQVSLIKEL